MAAIHKVCPECGLSINVGIAECPHCGAKVGTLFSESEALPVTAHAKHRQHIAKQISAHQIIERAQERANNSLILGLTSFFCPGIGFLTSGASILLGVLAARALKQHNVEEGRGSAIAGIVVGSIALIAQVCYLIYVIKMGLPFFGSN